MKRLTLLGLLVGSLTTMTSCAPSATDAELKSMCENLVGLRGEIDTRTLEERSAKILESFGKRETLHNEQQAAALKGADAELEGALKEAEDKEAEDDEETQKKLKAQHAEIRKSLEQEGAAALADIKADKEAALAEAKAKVEETQKEFAEAVDTCIGEAKNEGLTQSVAQCRIKAESTDAYWNQCR